ncbi:MAG: lactonase family protein [Imperialibacter sp.]|uniref:lactonase family protein n=1 Tax=Imperialibacter sp. TaxID=2038411 RepID=UPI0032EDFC7F
MELRSKLFGVLIVLIAFMAGCTQQKPQETEGQDDKMEAQTIDLLVGVYTGGGSNGIYQLQFNTATGELSDSLLLVKTTNPSYLAISKDRQSVFSVNETQEGGVSSFSWDHGNNQLVEVSKLSTEGAHPCYVDISPSGRQIAVANYSSGNLAVYQLGEGLALQASPQIRQHEGSGPVVPNQKGPHAHCSIFKGGYLYAVDLGIDKVLAYPFAADGSLGEAHVAFELQPGDGPRHLIFHPTKAMAFVVNELSSSVVSLKADLDKGTFEAIDRKSTIPDDFTEKNSDADIHITSDGKFLYASNRGHHSIAMYAVADDGSLTSLGNEPVGGKTPRNFTLSPDEKFLLVANQDTNNIVVFTRNTETGLLAATGKEFSVSKPVCLKF